MHKCAEGVNKMSLNIQNNVTMPQNQIAFSAKKPKLPKGKISWLDASPETVKESGSKTTLYNGLIEELKSLKKPIQDTQKLEHEHTQAMRAQALAQIDTKTLTTPNSLLDIPADNAHFITKDLETDVAANIGRRLKEQLLREQGWRFDAAKDIEGYKI